MSIVVNPGSGGVAGESFEDARENVEHLASEVAALRNIVFAVTRDPDEDRYGRYGFVLTAGDERRTVRMPGLPLERVRFTAAPGQSAWDYPRLYVDGSSWLWLYAVRTLSSPPYEEEDDDD